MADNETKTEETKDEIKNIFHRWEIFLFFDSLVSPLHGECAFIGAIQ